jgi:hypothetical protein
VRLLPSRAAEPDKQLELDLSEPPKALRAGRTGTPRVA